MCRELYKADMLKRQHGKAKPARARVRCRDYTALAVVIGLGLSSGDWTGPSLSKRRAGEEEGSKGSRNVLTEILSKSNMQSLLAFLDEICIQRVLKAHACEVNSCEYSTTGSTILTRSFGDKSPMKLWDPNGPATPQHALFDGRRDVVHCVLSPDGNSVLSGHEGGKLRLWDAVTGKLQYTLDAHTKTVRFIIFSPDGKTFLSCANYDSRLMLWETESANLLHVLKGHMKDGVSCACFSADGRSILSGSYDKMIKVWDATTGSLQQCFSGHSSAVAGCAFSPDGKTALSWCFRTDADDPHASSPKLWNPSTGPRGEFFSAPLQHTLDGHNQDVTTCSFRPDGTMVLTASFDCMVKLWNSASGLLVHTLTGHTGHVTRCCFSPDGRTVVSAARDKTLRVWNATTGGLKQILEEETKTLTDFCFHPDGKTIVSMRFYDGTLSFWE
jgi:WD40 repeat protein